MMEWKTTGYENHLYCLFHSLEHNPYICLFCTFITSFILIVTFIVSDIKLIILNRGTLIFSQRKCALGLNQFSQLVCTPFLVELQQYFSLAGLPFFNLTQAN